MAKGPHSPCLAPNTSKFRAKNRPGPPPEAQKEYPWDSHQDDIIVNTTEGVAPGRKRGIEHYRYQLTLRKTYEHITTDFAEDYSKIPPKDALPVPTSSSPPSSDDENSVNGDGDTIDEHSNDKTHLPKPKFNRLNYSELIYRATTTNPAVLLAIIRIAERNLALINFDSAITHLPNVDPNAALPSLLRSLNTRSDQSAMGKEHAEFTQDLPYPQNKGGDEMTTVLFLPEFYKDGRHALGYYDLAPGRDDGKRLEVENIVQVLFTPCDTQDLVRWGLVQWNYDAASLEEAKRLDEVAKKEDEDKEREMEGDGVGGGNEEMMDEGEQRDSDSMEYVAVRGGKWLDFAVVEDYNEWAEGFRVVRRIWEKMIKGVVTRGEDSGT